MWPHQDAQYECGDACDGGCPEFQFYALIFIAKPFGKEAIEKKARWIHACNTTEKIAVVANIRFCQ